MAVLQVLLGGFSIALAMSTPMRVTRQAPSVVGVVEYSTQCKSCPYQLCTNVNIPWGGDEVSLSCWAAGELVGDTDTWLKTADGCYLSEYDLIEYTGDFTEDLPPCGDVPLDITEEDATIRYLSECKWGYGTSSESMLFYGRDADTTLTCWTEGDLVLDNMFWYKTLDNCHVSGSGLWAAPDHDLLDNCGPEPGPRINESGIQAGLEQSRRAVLTDLREREDNTHLARRWLQPEQIGEEYAPCYRCPSKTDCGVKTTYEFNDTVVSQCVTSTDIVFPNGTFESYTWLLTTDWCYVEGWYFWVPPWDNYRYPRCEYWSGFGTEF